MANKLHSLFVIKVLGTNFFLNKSFIFGRFNSNNILYFTSKDICITTLEEKVEMFNNVCEFNTVYVNKDKFNKLKEKGNIYEYGSQDKHK